MEPIAPDTSNICAIVVTYQPDPGLIARMIAIASQVRAVIVVDNASGSAYSVILDGILRLKNLTLILNPENYGIAQALNTGVRHAAASGFDWAILLDQDTSFEPDLIASLISVYAEYPDKSNLAIIGAHFYDRHRVTEKSTVTPIAGPGWQPADWVITSGSLISLAAFTIIGPFREDLFIDFVDTEYCLRARRSGFQIIRTAKVLMQHAIGASTPHRIFGMQKWTTNHTPDRRYYMTRNYTILLRESGKHRFGLWAVKGLIASLKSIKRIALYEQDKAAKLIAVFQGWSDAVRGRTGKRRAAKTRSLRA
ncbi:MAG TPA: glycosyltransferase family 2 protein [Burkholderiales bacterium]|nr:glycosyltransferase family 2 protein [Burkholderiales bacterium]